MRLVALSRPARAEEVALDLPTTIVSASQDEEAARFVQERRRSCGCTPTGVELSGALKNVIALGVGVSTGLGYGDNARAALRSPGPCRAARLWRWAAISIPLRVWQALAICDLLPSRHGRNKRPVC